MTTDLDRELFILEQVELLEMLSEVDISISKQ